MSWRDSALCKGKHIEIWYPPLDELGHNRYYDVAKLICEHCPVRLKCFEEGQGEEFGCWGGQTPKERRKGTIEHPRKYLPRECLSMIPPPSHEPLDIDKLRSELFPHAKRRARDTLDVTPQRRR